MTPLAPRSSQTLRTLTLRPQERCYADWCPSLPVQKIIRVTPFMDSPLPRERLWPKINDTKLKLKHVETVDLSEYMSKNRFGRIRWGLEFVRAESLSDKKKAEDPFSKLTPVVEAFNEQRKRHIHAGSEVCADESMSEYYSEGQEHLGGCPHQTRIARKPKELGWNSKTLLV